MALDYFSQEHPLTLMEEPNAICMDKYEKVRKCDMCSDPVFWCPYYTCNKCEFFIHKSCAQLPRQKQLPSHRCDRSLTLEYSYGVIDCRCCGQKKDFIYGCFRCRYFVDVICANVRDPHLIKHPSHNHPLTRLIKPLLSKCDACGDTHEMGIFYHCTTCLNFWIHQGCASLNPTIKPTIHHNHSLALAYTIPSQYSSFRYDCDICCKELDPEYWVYYCGECRFFAHVKCATSKNEPFMSIPLPRGKHDAETKEQDTSLEVVHFPVEDEFVNLISHFRRGIGLVENEGISSEIDPFNHDHPLILFDGQCNEDNSSSQGKFCPTHGTGNNERLCAACVKPISVGPFYKCATNCDFFLHKCCAELPRKIKHPCHPEHPLLLRPKSPNFFSFFKCKGCRFYCNGFTYGCVDCEYYLDVECGSLPRAIKHEAHGSHLLFLKAEIWIRCNVCNDIHAAAATADAGTSGPQSPPPPPSTPPSPPPPPSMPPSPPPPPRTTLPAVSHIVVKLVVSKFTRIVSHPHAQLDIDMMN